MRRMLIVALLVTVPILVVRLGFGRPAPVPSPEVGPARLGKTAVLYDGLPPALEYYLRQTIGRTPPITGRALVWGTGEMRFTIGPFQAWLPLSWVERIDVARGFQWRAEVTWWGLPVWAICDTYLRTAGQGLDHPRGGCDSLVAHFLPDREAAHRAQAVWLPSSLITQAGVSWQPLDELTCEMRYPGEHPADRLTAHFDRRTRALVSLSGVQASGDAPYRWQVRFTEWDAPGGLMVPVTGQVLVDGKARYRFEVAGIAYNTAADASAAEQTPRPQAAHP